MIFWGAKDEIVSFVFSGFILVLKLRRLVGLPFFWRKIKFVFGGQLSFLKFQRTQTQRDSDLVFISNLLLVAKKSRILGRPWKLHLRFLFCI